MKLGTRLLLALLLICYASAAYAAIAGSDLPINQHADHLEGGLRSFLYIFGKIMLLVSCLVLAGMRRIGLLSGVGIVLVAVIIGMRNVEWLNYFGISGSLF